MRVVESVIKSEGEPRISVQHEQVLAMMLQPGSYQSGLRRSELTRHECYAGQLILCHRDVEVWIRRGELHVLNIVVSDAVLTGANDGKNDGFAVRRPSLRSYRGGLSPTHVRRVTEWVRAKIEEELTLREMAQLVDLSISHFSEMFRKSTGETPHQFVLRQRVERAKEMLRATETRVLDVAIACGFKTQQHFARVFRRLSGLSPPEYRQGHDESERSDPGGRNLDTTCVL